MIEIIKRNLRVGYYNKAYSNLILLIIVGLCFSNCKNNVAPVGQNNKNYTWMYDGLGTWETNGDTMSIIKTMNPNFKIRRPSSIAIIDDLQLENFELTARIQCGAAEDNVHGDVLLIFGYQSPTQFYYTHLSGLVDDVHTGIFVVDNADRKRLDDFASSPILTDRDWHNVKLRKNDGLIQVFIDDKNAAHLSVVDDTFAKGGIGIGSFDDTAQFTNINVENIK